MNIRGITARQTAVARQQLCSEINRVGHMFTVYSPLYKDDGCGGKILVGETTKKIKGVLVNGGQTNNAKMASDDGKRRYSNTHALICMYEECNELKFASRIEYENMVYHVVKVENVDYMNVSYRISLSHTNRNMEAYNG